MKIHHLNEPVQTDKDGNPVDSITLPLGGTLVRNQPDPRQVRAGTTRLYKFVRDERGNFVCDINHTADLRRFLSIREGYAPYGQEAEQEATDKFGWTYDIMALDVKRDFDDDDSQPQVVTELFDEDGNIIEVDDIDEDDEDDELKVPEDFVPPNLGELPAVPAKNADGSLWMAYISALPGIAGTKPADMKAKLREYGEQNYGVSLKGKGVLHLAKEIGQLQTSTQ